MSSSERVKSTDEEGRSSGVLHRRRRHRRSAAWWLQATMRMCDESRANRGRGCKELNINNGRQSVQVILQEEWQHHRSLADVKTILFYNNNWPFFNRNRSCAQPILAQINRPIQVVRTLKFVCYCFSNQNEYPKGKPEIISKVYCRGSYYSW